MVPNKPFTMMGQEIDNRDFRAFEVRKKQFDYEEIMIKFSKNVAKKANELKQVNTLWPLIFSNFLRLIFGIYEGFIKYEEPIKLICRIIWTISSQNQSKQSESWKKWWPIQHNPSHKREPCTLSFPYQSIQIQRTENSHPSWEEENKTQNNRISNIMTTKHTAASSKTPIGNFKNTSLTSMNKSRKLLKKDKPIILQPSKIISNL